MQARLTLFMWKVLEHLEENPTSSADDWGDEIAADKKLYSSSSSSSRCKRKKFFYMESIVVCFLQRR